ncbi:hypothetical protein GCM10010197_41590 [Nocardioides luteus]|uniref:Uncharacterized protein n=1 Tax=Nocardioides luteus TaxID=1844 RepID=A0ABQ5SU64_9ACTN|nr:hypothetical protein GCM10010197_41590 [Nocardioides luteus]GLJ67687.1 hypothetical protein GCM10017579_17230 [Nocardioides luteus]
MAYDVSASVSVPNLIAPSAILLTRREPAPDPMVVYLMRPTLGLRARSKSIVLGSRGLDRLDHRFDGGLDRLDRLVHPVF